MRTLYKILSSLKLTVILLILSMMVVFFGTLDQVHYGIQEAQRRYFESFFVAWSYPLQWVGSEYLRWLKIPMLGGYLLGSLLLLNLFFAHFKYYQARWKKIGIIFIHGGLVLLIISGFLTSFYQKEAQMWINLGGQSQYAESMYENELVLIDVTDEAEDHISAIPQSLLKAGSTHSIKDISIEMLELHENADIGLVSSNPGATPTKATKGAGARMGITIFPKAKTYKENETNALTGYVKLSAGGQDLGIWLVSNILGDQFPPQKFTHEGRTYHIAIRFKRTYFPFYLALKEFKHEKYPGTDIPRYFSSLIDIRHHDDPAKDRQVLIYMNHPLRYAGYTFFQASFGNQDKASMLQVVKNPARMLPYYAVLIIGLGLLIHFTLHLVRYLKRERAPEHA